MKKLLVAFAAVALMTLFAGVADAQTRGPRDSYPQAHHVAKQKAEQARQDMARRQMQLQHQQRSRYGHSGHSGHSGISPYRSTHPRSLYQPYYMPRQYYVPSYQRYCPPGYHLHGHYGGYGSVYGSFSGFGVRVQW